METFVMPCLPASPGSVPADGISPGRAEEGEMFLELFSLLKGLGNMEQTGQEEKAAEEEAENEEPAMPAVLPGDMPLQPAATGPVQEAFLPPAPEDALPPANLTVIPGAPEPAALEPDGALQRELAPQNAETLDRAWQQEPSPFMAPAETGETGRKVEPDLPQPAAHREDAAEYPGFPEEIPREITVANLPPGEPPEDTAWPVGQAGTDDAMQASEEKEIRAVSGRETEAAAARKREGRSVSGSEQPVQLNDAVDRPALKSAAADFVRQPEAEIPESSPEEKRVTTLQPARTREMLNAYRPNIPKVFNYETLRESVTEQVLQRMTFYSTPGGAKKLHVRLKPESLGEVEISLQLEKGRITARVVAENALVKEMLESSLGVIKQRLEAQQVVVHDFTVTVSGQGDSRHERLPGWQEMTGRQMQVARETEGEEIMASAPRGMVDLLV